jgi:hypothetical protein
MNAVEECKKRIIQEIKLFTVYRKRINYTVNKVFSEQVKIVV